eukprot:gene12911-13038_t
MALRRLAFSTGLRVQAAPLLESWSRAFATVLPDRKYAQSHEWAKADGDTAVIGISDHAQSELGEVVYVELPEVGSTVSKGETFAVVESVKANNDPYGDGWMIKVKLTNTSELDDLLDAKAYEATIDH